MTQMTAPKPDLKPITVNSRNRYFMCSRILKKPGFLCSYWAHRRNVQPSNICWELFSHLPRGRIALTRWLALKKRIQIKPLEPCSTGLSRWQRTKWQALHGKVTPCQHCHLLSFIYSPIYSVKGWRCSDYISPKVNCVTGCSHAVQSCFTAILYTPIADSRNIHLLCLTVTKIWRHFNTLHYNQLLIWFSQTFGNQIKSNASKLFFFIRIQFTVHKINC